MGRKARRCECRDDSVYVDVEKMVQALFPGTTTLQFRDYLKRRDEKIKSIREKNGVANPEPVKRRKRGRPPKQRPVSTDAVGPGSTGASSAGVAGEGGGPSKALSGERNGKAEATVKVELCPSAADEAESENEQKPGDSKGEVMALMSRATATATGSCPPVQPESKPSLAKTEPAAVCSEGLTAAYMQTQEEPNVPGAHAKPGIVVVGEPKSRNGPEQESSTVEARTEKPAHTPMQAGSGRDLSKTEAAVVCTEGVTNAKVQTEDALHLLAALGLQGKRSNGGTCTTSGPRNTEQMGMSGIMGKDGCAGWK